MLLRLALQPSHFFTSLVQILYLHLQLPVPQVSIHTLRKQEQLTLLLRPEARQVADDASQKLQQFVAIHLQLLLQLLVRL